MTNSNLVPLLVVRDARRAIDFYTAALGATVVACYAHGPERLVSHAELTAFDSAFAVTEEALALNSDAPPSLGGSPVVLQLRVTDTDALVRSMCGAGAVVVFPVQEFLGERMAHVRDPFGHLWLLRQPLAKLTRLEEQNSRDALYDRARTEPESGRRGSLFHGEVFHTVGGERLPVQAHPIAAKGAGKRKGKQTTCDLVVGPVGAGKSTLALRLASARSLLRLTLDDWFVALFTPDRPESGVAEWYRERAERCVQQISRVALEVVRSGTGVVLEIGMLHRQERERFYESVRKAGVGLRLHVVDAERGVRRERVLARNQAPRGRLPSRTRRAERPARTCTTSSVRAIAASCCPRSWRARSRRAGAPST
ncbi:MAG TPA: AAA family ATPase [Polyangiaceae bacterium]|jgi:uncharacterized glyoxalase superfamily protein PhnB/predicted kinase|nr:AAA family ATPase [Polyangiaceae bacterium]